MNHAESIMRQSLDGNFWQICNATNAIIHKRVALDYIPTHKGFDFSEAGKLARRNSKLTHRNKKRELEGDDMATIRILMQSMTNMEDIAIEFRARGRRASARAVCGYIRQIRASNGQ
jgi:hypothetical protein